MASPSGLAPAGSVRKPRTRKKRAAGGPVSVNYGNEEDQQLEEDQDREIFDDRGNLIRIEHPDGAITINLDGKPIRGADDDTPKGWYENLVERIDDNEQGRIVDDLMRGIDDDIESRREWLEMRERGISLLGLTLDEGDSTGGSPDGVAVEGQSNVKHPLLKEAVLRFQANARSEMLPTDGPVKIRDDDNNAPAGEDELAQCLEKDFNHFLTVTDRNYVADTDRMLLWLGFGGTTFKKVYFDPLKQRPTSVSVDPDDLIISNSAITLHDAPRVTHRTLLSQSIVKRMQLLGIYADVDLGTPAEPRTDSLRNKKRETEGRASTVSLRPQDRDREIYECYCELDILGFEHKWNGKVSGLPVPYVVTIDVSSRKMLACSRNYPRPAKGKLPEAREVFIDYHFVPGLGFFGIGLLHILADATLAVTAAWRELLDAGMFASFPGFLYAKGAGRQNTNIFRVPPGGGVEIDTMGQSIRDAVLPLPYKTEGMQALMALAENIVQTAERVGMVSESEVGEGKQNAPVGTTLALIEQAQKILNSVHKRMHAAQAREFQLLAQVFREHPESFWISNKKPALPWDQKTFMDALDNYYLVPQADPNTASQMQRIAKVGALFLLAQGAPQLYDMKALHELALRTLGWGNAKEFFKPDDQQSQPTPEQMAAMAEIQVKQALAEAKKQEVGIKGQELQLKAQDNQGKLGLAQARLNMDAEHLKTDDTVKIVKTKIDTALKGREIDQKIQEGITAEKMNLIDVAQNLAVHPESAHLVAPLIKPAYDDIREQEERERESRKGFGAAKLPDVPEG